MRTIDVMAAVEGVQSDEELVAKLRERDSSAFTVLYDRYNRMAFGLAYRMLSDPLAAEDVVQDAFLSVWRQAETFQAERSAVRTWILSIVHHRAIDRIRRGTAAREISAYALEQATDRADDSVDIEHEVGTLLEAGQVRQALGLLPSEQRRAIEMAYFAGLSHSEIAGELKVPLGTVKGRLRIGLQKLRALLDAPRLQGVANDS